jgi:tetratricopeptide (TPR) repeat protein
MTATARYAKNLIFLCLLSLFLPESEAWGELSPQRAYDPDIVRGIELLYNMGFDQAEDVFSRKIVEDPSDPAGYFYLAMVSWSRLASGFWLPEVVRTYGERIDRTISVAKRAIKEGEPDSYTYFYLGGALGFKGRFLLMQRKYLSSFFLARDAVKALKTCQAMDPTNKDVLLGLGIFDYYTARLSGARKFLSFLLIHKGDKEEGLRKLNAVANEALYSATEAKSLLLHIYLFSESDHEKALPLAKEMAQGFWKDPLYQVLAGVVYLKLDMDREYKATLDSFYDRSREQTAPQKAAIWRNRGLYLEATAHLFRRRYDEARSLLRAIRRSTDETEDPLMMAWPLLKIGMTYDLEGAREKALECYQEILNSENGAGAQFLAEKYTRKPAVKDDPFLGY